MVHLKCFRVQRHCKKDYAFITFFVAKQKVQHKSFLCFVQLQKYNSTSINLLRLMSPLSLIYFQSFCIANISRWKAAYSYHKLEAFLPKMFRKMISKNVRVSKNRYLEEKQWPTKSKISPIIGSLRSTERIFSPPEAPPFRSKHVWHDIWSPNQLKDDH